MYPCSVKDLPVKGDAGVRKRGEEKPKKTSNPFSVYRWETRLGNGTMDAGRKNHHHAFAGEPAITKSRHP
jgi:hypothetical protein